MTAQSEYESRPTTPAIFATALFFSLFACAAAIVMLGIVPWSGWRHDMPVSLSSLDILRLAHWERVTLLPIIGAYDLHHTLMARLAVIIAGAIVAGIAAGLIAWRATPTVDARRHVEGLRRIGGKAAIRTANAAMADEVTEAGRDHLLAPGVRFSRIRSLVNTLILGAPGSGKTRIVLFLIEQILAGFRSPRDATIGILAHDTTGELRRGFPLGDEHVACVGVNDKDSWAWALGEDVVTLDDADAVARRLLHERPGERHGNAVFDAGGATILTGCIAICQRAHGRTWGAAELFEATLLDPVSMRERLEQAYPAAAALLDMGEDGRSLSKTSASFVLTFRAQILRVLAPLARSWKNVPAERRFSFVRWLNGDISQPRAVLLQRSARHAELSAAWIGAVVDLIAAHATDVAFNSEHKLRLHLILDEIHQLGPLGRFQELLDVGRNKNVSVIATLQDLNQLRISYGQAGAENMLGRFATMIVGRMRQGEAAIQVSERLIGKRSVINPQDDRGRDAPPPPIREVPIIRPERLSSELGVIDGRVRALVIGFGDILELTWPVTIWKTKR